MTSPAWWSTVPVRRSRTGTALGVSLVGRLPGRLSRLHQDVIKEMSGVALEDVGGGPAIGCGMSQMEGVDRGR